MNKELKYKDKSKLLFVDMVIEDKVEMSPKIRNLYNRAKERSVGEEGEYHTSKPIFKDLTAVSFSYFNTKDKKWRVNVLTGSEGEICEQSTKILSKMEDFFLVGWNLNAYKLPFLRLKSTSLGIDYTEMKINESGKKPWDLEGKVYDLLPIIMGSFYSKMSFEEVCALYNIDFEEPEDYSEDVELYCEQKIIAVIELFDKITNPQAALQEVEESGEKFLDKIYNQGTVFEEDKKAIKKMARNMNQEEINMFCDIIQAATLQKGGDICREISRD